MAPNLTREEKVLRARGIKKCSQCGRVINISGFKDSGSLREYNENGCCQKCQDNPFGGKDNA